MSLTAVLALVHDTLIVLGIYSLSGREVTPNTMAALLTILGYSLYDTIVVFHRIRENSRNLQKQTFMEMANESINQVMMRWINTSLTSVIPVTCLSCSAARRSRTSRLRCSWACCPERTRPWVCKSHLRHWKERSPASSAQEEVRETGGQGVVTRLHRSRGIRPGPMRDACPPRQVEWGHDT